MSLQGKTLFITGASRGIGLAIALRAARDGANVAVAAKTAEPHKHLPGTIFSAAEEIERAGGKALPLVVDVREEASVQAAVEQTVARFGGIDICVNNASAIQLTGTLQTEMKRYDLMQSVNTRGTFLTSKVCIPHLKRAANPHVLTLSPPLDMRARWFQNHVAYTIAKFGMSLCVLGMAEEFRGQRIAFNALWPRTGIATAAVEFALSGAEAMRHCRTPEIMADAAYAVFNRPSADFTGNFLIDDSFLYAEGVRDFDRYRVDPSKPLMPDFFVPDESAPPPGVELGAGSLTRGPHG
jgi:citronellol/citronellal dehydrogenase